MRTALKKDEKLLLVIRHHWLKLAPAFLIWLLVGILAVLIFKAGTATVIILLAALYPLIVYFIWVHNIWAVTNLRVIDEGGFFTRYAKESPLDKINNIEYDQTFWGRILGYGDVDIQTAAEMGETKYRLIHHPKQLKDTITQAQEEYKKSQLSNQAQQLARAIASQQNLTGTAASPAMVADELKKLFELAQAGAITAEEYEVQKGRLLKG